MLKYRTKAPQKIHALYIIHALNSVIYRIIISSLQRMHYVTRKPKTTHALGGS